MIYTTAARASALAAVGQSDNPFVAWNNLAATATLSGTNVLADGARANAVTGTTYDRWRPDIGGTMANLICDLGTAQAVGCAGIAAHNAATFGASVRVAYSSDDITYTDASDLVTPTDNSAIFLRFNSVSARYWRFRFTSLTAGDLLSVGVAFLGQELILDRFYQGFAPPIVPTEVQLQSNVSVGGNLVGSSVVAQGSTLSAQITNVAAATIRSASFLSFMRHFNEGKPIFFGWRPLTFAQDAWYCWRDGAVIRPESAGVRDLMNFTLNARAYEAA